MQQTSLNVIFLEDYDIDNINRMITKSFSLTESYLELGQHLSICLH